MAHVPTLMPLAGCLVGTLASPSLSVSGVLQEQVLGKHVPMPVPVFPQYGQRAISNNVTTIAVTAAVDGTLATNTDYIQVTGIWNATPDGVNRGITQGTNDFVIHQTGDYDIRVWATVRHSANVVDIAFKFAVNGTITLVRRPLTHLPLTGDPGNISAFGFAHFNAGDVISLWVASTKTGNLTITDAVFGAVFVG